MNVVAEADRASKPDGLRMCARRRPATRPYPTRAEIEQGALAGKGLELLYLEDPVEVFFMHIQGSARIHLTDGTTVRINYDGKNGHPYTSIGRYLIDNGLLDANKVSMAALGKWLRADKARGQQVMWQNQSFIFFRESVNQRQCNFLDFRMLLHAHRSKNSVPQNLGSENPLISHLRSVWYSCGEYFVRPATARMGSPPI